MINLNQTPEAILTMKDGEQATLDGHTVRLDVDNINRQHNVYLTVVSDTSNIKLIDPDDYDQVHVRSYSDVAVMGRDTLVDRLKTKQYFFG